MNFFIKIPPPGHGTVAVAYNNDAEPIEDPLKAPSKESDSNDAREDRRSYRFSVAVLGDHGPMKNPGPSALIERSDGIQHAVRIEPDEYEDLPNEKKLHITAPDKTTVDFMLGKTASE